MRHLFSVSILALASLSVATPGVLLDATNDTVVRITYTGGSPNGNDPTLVVTGEKSYGAKIGGTWRGVTGFVPGYAEPFPASPAGVAGAGAIGLAGYGTGGGSYTIGAHLMTNASNPSANNYGAEINVSGGSSTYGVLTSVYGLSSVYGVEATASGGSYVTGVSTNAYGSDYVYGLNAGAWGGAYDNWAAWFNGDTWATGFYLGSDQKLKKNVVDYTGALSKVLALKPKSYDMKVEEFKDQIPLPKGRQIGLIAQEIETVLPELVTNATAPARLTEDERKNGVKKKGLEVKSVNYTGLIPVLIAAVQEQQALIQKLQSEVASLKAGK